MINDGTILDSRGAPMTLKSSAYVGGASSRKRKSQAYRRSLPYDEDRALKSSGRANLRLECSDMRRNNPIVGGVCERFSDNIVGAVGLTPQPKTADDSWNDEAREYWNEWSKVCDYRRRVNMRDLQRIAVQSRLIQGDMGTALLDNGQLQPFESERIDTPNKLRNMPNVIDGIQIDGAGAPRTYYLINRNDRGGLDREQYKTYDRTDFIHLTRSWRLDQLRGIPELANVMPMLVDFARLQEETLNKAQLDAMHAWLITTSEGAAKAANLGPRNTSSANSNVQHEAFDGGMNYYLNKGEDAKSLASNTPNPQYVEYSKLMLKLIGGALSMPYEMLMLDFSEGSFSSSRAALQQTYNTFSMWQSWLIDGYLQRIWNWRIAKAIRDGDIPPAPQNDRGISQWYKVQWQRPGYDWLDPSKESKANIDNWNMGACSLDDITRKAHGREASDVMDAKIRNVLYAHNQAEASGIPNFTWRDVINSTSAGMAPPAIVNDQPITGEDDEPSTPSGGNKWLR